MATTGFWPVKSRLKEVIDYAENPDKTIDKKYVDSDLYAALQYAADDKKTDERMYVSGINCNAKRAYERMTATKKRFGKVGGNVAYHGYQSFQSREVTAEEAHKIGMETARRMWGKEYEIVVTTHLNTDNIHNHFVVNSVSFKTGRKFENHISDHYRLREISDTVCVEHGKSVLKDAAFYNGEKKDYWLKKKGNMTHRELLKSDIDSAVAQSTNFKAFEIRLKDMGYEIRRDENFAHYSVKAPGWQRAIRLDRLGNDYTPAAIRERLLDNQRHIGYVPFQKPKYAPLILFEIEYRKTKNIDGIQVIFALVIELCKLITGNNITPQSPRPLSPEMRQEVVKLDKTLKEYKFLCENHIDSPRELVSFITKKREQIGTLEGKRQSVYNRNRHKKSKELNAQAREITAKIKPLREELNTAKAVLEKIPKFKELLEIERQMEKLNPPKKKAANIPVDKLHTFEGHPFKILDNEEMGILTESIKEQGVLSPLIVRSMENKSDEYEVISGHRRLYASVKAGLKEVPALIYSLDRNSAVIAVVDSNIHREKILPSEKAFSYKMKMEAMKAQGKRTDLTLSQAATKSDTAAEIGKTQGESRDQVFRYIRLTNLIPELLQKVDEGMIALSPAVELSYLSEEQQKTLLDAMSLNDCTPSHAQSIRMKKSAQQGTLSSESIYEIMSEEKANQTEHISFKVQDLRAFFPKHYTQKQMTDTILKLLYDYNRKLERKRNSRDER